MAPCTHIVPCSCRYSYLDARRGDAPDRTPVTGARKLLLTVLGGLFYIIFASLFVAAPIGMVVVGTQKKEECPSRDRLPTWMVTQGTTLRDNTEASMHLIYLFLKHNFLPPPASYADVCNPNLNDAPLGVPSLLFLQASLL